MYKWNIEENAIYFKNKEWNIEENAIYLKNREKETYRLDKENDME